MHLYRRGFYEAGEFKTVLFSVYVQEGKKIDSGQIWIWKLDIE